MGGVGGLGQLALDRRLKDTEDIESCPLPALLGPSCAAPCSSPAMIRCSQTLGSRAGGLAHSQLKAMLESPWNKAMPWPSSSALQRDSSSSAP